MQYCVVSSSNSTEQCRYNTNLTLSNDFWYFYQPLSHSEAPSYLSSHIWESGSSTHEKYPSKMCPSTWPTHMLLAGGQSRQFLNEKFYIPLVRVVKTSFLLFFKRIFLPRQKMKYCTRFGFLAIWVFYIALSFRSILCD